MNLLLLLISTGTFLVFILLVMLVILSNNNAPQKRTKKVSEDIKKIKEQISIIYENQVETLTLIKGYKLHQKIQYMTLGGMSAVIIFLFNYIFFK